MEEFYSSVSPKGQVTVPQKIRRMLGLGVKDQVRFRVVGDQVVLSRAESQLARIYQSVPALAHPMTDREMTDVAWEEHALEAAKEGLEDE